MLHASLATDLQQWGSVTIYGSEIIAITLSGISRLSNPHEHIQMLLEQHQKQTHCICFHVIQVIDSELNPMPIYLEINLMIVNGANSHVILNGIAASSSVFNPDNQEL